MKKHIYRALIITSLLFCNSAFALYATSFPRMNGGLLSNGMELDPVETYSMFFKLNIANYQTTGVQNQFVFQFVPYKWSNVDQVKNMTNYCVNMMAFSTRKDISDALIMAEKTYATVDVGVSWKTSGDSKTTACQIVKVVDHALE